GEDVSLSPAAIRKAMSLVARDALFERVQSVALLQDGWGAGAQLEERTTAALDGFLDGTYRWTMATEKKKAGAPAKMTVVYEDARWRERIAAAIERAEAIRSAVSFARDLA